MFFILSDSSLVGVYLGVICETVEVYINIFPVLYFPVYLLFDFCLHLSLQ